MNDDVENDEDFSSKMGGSASSEPPIFDRRATGEGAAHKRAIFGVPVDVVVSVGRARPMIGELLNMRRDTLLPLDSKVSDPVEIIVGKRVIARGELQELSDDTGKLGVRLTEVVDLNKPF
jgi:flagellar motor switch protein FliN/FliY